MNRRNLLTTAAATVMLPSAVKAAEYGQVAHPDADLIIACNEYLRIERAWSAHCEAVGERDIEDDDPALAMLEPLPALVEQIVALRATTAEGHLARARCMAFAFLPGHSACQDDPEGATEDRLEAAMLRDLTRMERGPA